MKKPPKSILGYRSNWKDAELYPNPNKLDLKLLAWEFLRRNDSYAVDATRMLSLPSEIYEKGFTKNCTHALEGMECSPPAVKGDTAKSYFSRNKRGRIDRPQNTFLNRWCLKYPVSVDTTYDPEIVQFDDDTVGYKRSNNLDEAGVIRLFLNRNEVVVRFRLDSPFDPQLKLARLKLLDLISLYSKHTEKRSLKYIAGYFNSAPLSPPRLNKDILKHVHYLLRSYDALSSRKLAKKSNGKKKLTGEREILNFLNADRSGKSPLTRGRIDSWYKTADKYINGLKYQRLLHLNCVTNFKSKSEKLKAKVVRDVAEKAGLDQFNFEMNKFVPKKSIAN